MSEPTTPPAGSRIDRLLFTLKALHGFAVSEGGPANPSSATAADLAALVAVLEAADADLPSAADVPEWDNWTDEEGNLYPLGSVAHNYAEWSRETDEPASEHDGACQLADMADALTDTLNALDALAFDRTGSRI
jgi:hypothetical protein